MIKLTIDKLLKRTEPDCSECCVYVFRDMEAVFYVGSATRILSRVLTHLGRGPWSWGGQSAMARLLIANAPASRDWQVEFLTMADCVPYVKRYFPAVKQYSIALAEKAMIRHYRPCLNDVDNPAFTIVKG